MAINLNLTEIRPNSTTCSLCTITVLNTLIHEPVEERLIFRGPGAYTYFLNSSHLTTNVGLRTVACEK